MIVIVVPKKVDDNVAAMTPVIQNIWLGYLTAASKNHQSLQWATQKGYTATFKMVTPIVVTKLDGGNGYCKFRVNQAVMGLILLNHGISFDYKSKFQYTYEMI